MKKRSIIKSLCWVFIIFSFSLKAQDSYQSSVNTGIGFGISILADTWKDGVITDDMVFSPGFDMTISYGLSERLGVMGAYQRIFPATLNEKEVAFLVTTDNISHQNFLGGLKFIGGSPSSAFRYFVNAGLFYASSNVKIEQKEYGNFTNIRLQGPGFFGGVGLDYFLSPYMSIMAKAGYKSGRYKSSEYLGITYKESIKWSGIQISAGINYHFDGR